MASFQISTEYDRLYEATRRAVRGWPATRLSIALGLAMLKASRSEARWGQIDALSDALGKIPPTDWRVERDEGQN
jgi:hypothetical protein